MTTPPRLVRRLFILSLLLCLPTPSHAAEEWAPAKGPLMTKWAPDVKPDNVLPEYPRPQMVRKEWMNLNGLWDYAIRLKTDTEPMKAPDGKILVPFPIESALSGVMKPVGPDHRLWYRRSFKVPAGWAGKRLLLHFGAVDWQAEVFVNGKLLLTHKGGYDPFSVDVTDALGEEAEQELMVGVYDPTDRSTQPRGKQVLKPGGIMYTAVTGIWQTVWLEPVSGHAHVQSLKITPDLDGGAVEVEVRHTNVSREGHHPYVEVLDGDKVVAKAEQVGERTLRIKLPSTKPWTPDDPFLYGLRVRLVPDWHDDAKRFDMPSDVVESYFGMRKTSLGKDENGVTRLMLNNKFVFQFGPLDQGWWPDGLYTAPTDAALKYDIEVTKQLGFNMARKHVKVEPARWYYWCDKLGLLVWQDMPSGDKGIAASDKEDLKKDPEAAKQFEAEWARIIAALHNHPSIVMWVPFNEGWGQYDTARIVDYTRKLDPTRLVDNASGWTDRGVGDVHDWHVYPGPGSPQPEEKRAAVLGEFGGLGLPVEGHTWQPKGNWGYRSFTDAASLENAYLGLLTRTHRLIGKPGLSAAVYTQTTDVEIEVNGLLTYDRAVIKVDAARVAAAAKALHGPPPQVVTLIADARTQPATWKYTTEKPADGWEKAGFDDGTWKSGEAGFGALNPPGSIIKTEWKTPEIWIRRTFEVPEGTAITDPQLSMHHDEDAEVYLNGVRAVAVQGYTTGYDEFPISREAAATLKAGKNTIAIHVKQTGGGQYIDAGLVNVVPAQRKAR